jgi:hypothetical protein
MGNEKSCDGDIEQKGDGDLDIHEYAFAIAYLQVGKVSIELTPKEYDYIMHKAIKQFKWEGNSFLWVWMDG